MHRQVPYQCLVYGWGYHRDFRIAFWGDIDYPKHFLDYYMEEGALRVDPLFCEVVKTEESQILDELIKGNEKIDARFLEKVRFAGLEHTIAGGTIENEWTAFFATAFKSEELGKNSFKLFNDCVPLLSTALRKAYPHPRLTKLQWRVLDLLSRGARPKAIAEQLSISEIHVQSHLKEARRKLHAKTNEHAIRKAVATGLFSIPINPNG